MFRYSENKVVIYKTEGNNTSSFGCVLGEQVKEIELVVVCSESYLQIFKTKR
jgi:hypothetical protein